LEAERRHSGIPLGDEEVALLSDYLAAEIATVRPLDVVVT